MNRDGVATGPQDAEVSDVADAWWQAVVEKHGSK